jgi:hypothetical protein
MTISLSHQMQPGQNVKAFWRHVVGLALVEMKKRGWTAAKILDASWQGGALTLTVGPGHDRLSAEKVAEFIQEKRRKAR